VPAVAGGRVYVGTADSLVAYGLLADATPAMPEVPLAMPPAPAPVANTPGGVLGTDRSPEGPPPAPAEKIVLVRGPFRVDPRSGLLAQQLTLRNEGSGPIEGPLTLVLDDLPRGVRLGGPRGVRVTHTPQGDRYRLVALPGLQPGQGVMVRLAFAGAGRRTVRYRLRVL
jgi:hypothetical protein